MFLYLMLSTFLIQARLSDPTATIVVEEATNEELTAQQNCVGYKNGPAASSANYARCIAEEGIKAQEAKRQREETAAALQRPSVCRPEDAVKNCEEHLKSSTKISDNPEVDFGIKKKSIELCQLRCNSSSVFVLENFMQDCSATDKQNIKKQMDVKISACGRYIDVARNKQVVVDGATNVWDKYVPAVVKDRFEIIGAINGVCEQEGSGLQSGVTYCERSLSEGVKVRTYDAIGAPTKVTKYIGVDGKSYDSYAEAAAIVPGLRARIAERQDGVDFADGGDGEPVTNYDPAELNRIRQFTSGGLEEPAPPETSPRPEARPTTPATPPVARNNPTSPNSDVQPSREVYSPPAPPQPLIQRASQPGAFLQNALNSPVAPASSGGGESVSALGEVGRGGGGFSGGGGSFGSSGSSSFRGGRNQSGASQPTEDGNSNFSDREAPEPIAGGAGGNPMNGGSGAMPMANMPAGRAMAAVSPSSLDPASGFRSEGFRSDLFYKTRGKEAPRAASKLVQVDPNCKPTKNKRCAMKSISVASSGGRKGCDGDPQCILKLTGKLNLPKLPKAGENFPQMQMAGTAQGDANGVRGVASVQGSSRRTLPEGVWRGTQNLLVHIDNYFGKHLQLDHEGLLVVDED